MLITTKEYAAKHGVGTKTITDRISRGTLKAQKIGRDWLIEEDEPFIDTRVKSGKYVKWRKNKTPED